MNIFEISESELVQLERGSPDSLFLNFDFLHLVCFELLTALLTTEIASLRVFAIIVSLCIIGYVAGAVLLALWLWHRQSRAAIFSDIRRRMPPDGIPVAVEQSP